MCGRSSPFHNRPFMARACQRTSYVFRETGWGVWVVPPANEPPSCPLGQQRRQPVDGEGFAPRQHLGERQPDLGPRPVELFRDRVGSARRGVDVDVEAAIRWWARRFAAEALEKGPFWSSSPVRHEEIVALGEARGSPSCEGSTSRIDCPLRRPPGPIWILGRELSKSLLLLTQPLPRSHPPTIAVFCAAPEGTFYGPAVRHLSPDRRPAAVYLPFRPVPTLAVNREAAPMMALIGFPQSCSVKFPGSRG